MTTFKELGVALQYCKNLESQGITEPTLVQEKALPLLRQGKDLVVRSKTGSGKTIAFLLPILERMDHTNRALQAIVLVPTRELAEQIYGEVHKLDPHAKALTIYGGVGIEPQVEALRKWAQIAICTPGRLLDHMERRTIVLDSVHFSVLDEADRMLDMGFIDDMRAIMAKLPKQRQTMLFSATMPEQVANLAQEYMSEPERLILEQDEVTVDKIRQRVLGLGQRDKLPTLIEMLKSRDLKRVMVFCNTKSWAEKLGEILERRRFQCTTIHSGLSQNKRQKVIDDFKAGRCRILIATDVAARGLHIDDVTHVFNYDLPKNPKDYVHRIGRTGRAGEEGDAISFLTTADEPLLRNIEREIKRYLPIELPGGKTQERTQYDLTSALEDTGIGGPYTKQIKQGFVAKRAAEVQQVNAQGVATSDW
ncbi:MAG: DEAD/DEAH box helicase, partial [Nanoarchaeota archaeon]